MTSTTSNILITYFNPLPRKEGDSSSNEYRSLDIYFNPLPRKEGDCSTKAVVVHDGDNFNPLPRKEGDISPNQCGTVANISIHSLVKRETF